MLFSFIDSIYYIDYGYHPDTNYGKSELLQSLSWTINGDSVVIRSFINFDFSSLPKRCKIIEARLSLCEYHTSGTPTQGHSHLSGSNACYIRRVISKWNENTITWNNQPETTDINEVTIPQDTLPTQDYTDIDVTNLIRDIINNPKKSYGLTIRLVDENNYRAMYFASSNYSNTLKHPALILKIQ